MKNESNLKTNEAGASPTFKHVVTFYPDTPEEAKKKMQPIIDMIDRGLKEGNFWLILNGQMYRIDSEDCKPTYEVPKNCRTCRLHSSGTNLERCTCKSGNECPLNS